MKETAINTGIIGYGLSGRYFHAPFLKTNPGFRVTKVVERHAQSALELSPAAEIVDDYRKVADDPEIDLAVIAVPNIFHYTMAKDCLQAGKHVVIEKPFVPYTKEADDLIALSQKVNRKIFVYHNRRWDGDFRTIRDILSQKLLGNLLEYEAHFDRFSPERKRAAWRDEPVPASGVLYDLGSHLIDQALVLFGKPGAVFADIKAQRIDSKVDDYFHIHLYYPHFTAILKAGVFVKEPGPRYILYGNKGSFIKKGIDPQEELLRKGLMPVGEHWGREYPENHGLLNISDNGIETRETVDTESGNYAAFYDNVHDVLTSDAEQAVKPEEARTVIRIIELAFKSEKTKSIIPFTER
ncbi:MAG TPA: Gfo/Idh/MocA family oxidoreductase [Bacteroidales bacterium]|nr:Gfo/Idh/MocA family oxidoreductase [Bacteroidales bacterium]